MSASHPPTESSIQDLHRAVAENPYSPSTRLRLAVQYAALKYPDLAAGEAYMALLLCDEIYDDCAEFHHEAFEAAKVDATKTIDSKMNTLSLAEGDNVESASSRIENWIRTNVEQQAYVLLSNSLLFCANFRSAYEFCSRGIKKFPENKDLEETLEQIETSARFLLKEPDATIEDFTDKGLVRREMYPWNDHEPDRYSESNMEILNTVLKQSAPKLEVLIVEMPSLRADDPNSTTKQLGLFAKEDLVPGDQILDEKSLLTATGRLNDVFCDACSAKLSLASSNAQACDECYEVVFCSPACATRAQEEYHPAVCSTGLESIARDAPPTEAATALYTLLLLRALSMAITQSEHPLDLQVVKYIWGDFNPVHTNMDEEAPKTLPFSFKYNILFPLNFLEKALDNADPPTNIFTSPMSQIWIFNTLLAKFRGTASAKQDLSGRPEVAAVHPLWCLANHSCDPNVRWEWEGSIGFWVREERVAWKGKGVVNKPGIKKGSEMFGHYCDIDFEVKERREWAEGALGGKCTCSRCMWEADGIEPPVHEEFSSS